MPETQLPCGDEADRVLPPIRPVVQSRLVRGLLIAAGSFCVVLGLIGVVMPLLPTTPFLLLAAACFMRSSEPMHRWLFTNRIFGEYLRRYYSGEGLPIATKVMILGLLWLTLGSSALFAIPDRLWWVRVILLGIGVAVTIRILRLKTAQAGR